MRRTLSRDCHFFFPVILGIRLDSLTTLPPLCVEGKGDENKKKTCVIVYITGFPREAVAVLTMIEPRQTIQGPSRGVTWCVMTDVRPAVTNLLHVAPWFVGWLGFCFHFYSAPCLV